MTSNDQESSWVSFEWPGGQNTWSLLNAGDCKGSPSQNPWTIQVSGITVIRDKHVFSGFGSVFRMDIAYMNPPPKRQDI